MEGDKQYLERIKRDVLYGYDIASPYVKMDKCKGCGLCVKVCPALVFELREKKSYVKYGEACFACGHCWAACPEGAVFQQDVETATSLKPGSNPAVLPDKLQLLFRERRSTRLFTEKPISKEQLMQIIDAGRYAPTGSNRQNVQYIVVSGKEKVSELRLLVESFMENTFKAMQNKLVSFFLAMKYGRATIDMMRYYALGYQSAKESKENIAYFPLPFGSAVIIAHIQSPSSDSSALFNCAIALYNCSLMAHSMGIGSCFLGFVQMAADMDRNTRQWLGIPKQNRASGAMVLGYPNVKYRRLVERKSPEIIWH